MRGINADQANRWVSIGVRAINCAVLAVRDCLFRFTVGPHQTDREDLQTMKSVGLLSAEPYGRFMHYSLVGATATATLLTLTHESGITVTIPLV